MAIIACTSLSHSCRRRRDWTRLVTWDILLVRVDNDSLQWHCCPQIWRSKKNSNSIQFMNFFLIKPLQPIGPVVEFKFESKFEPLLTSAGHLAITPESCSRRQLKDLTAKSMAKLLGQLSCKAWVGQMGENKLRAFPSRRQSLLAATGSLEENVLPLLLYWLSSRVNKVLMLCRYWTVTTDFFHLKWNFRWNWRKVVAYQSSAHHLAQSYYHSLVSE